MYALVTVCQLEWSEIYLYVISLKVQMHYMCIYVHFKMYMRLSKHLHFKDDSITWSSEKVNDLPVVTTDRSLVILHRLGH